MTHCDPGAVDSSVERLLQSRGFRRSDRLAGLLRFLVGRARLDPTSAAVKEYELGVEVFERPVGYDPRTDPIVRVSVRELRLKLAAYYANEGAGDPLRIEIPKGSYRVVFAPVPPSPPASEPQPPADARVEVPRTRATRERWAVGSSAWLGLSAVVLLAAAVGVTRLTKTEPPVPPGVATPSLAVLPFQNLSDDSTQDYFSDGLTDEIIGALAGVQALRVTGRTSVFSLKGTTADPSEIGRRLGVAAILSGSIRFEADRIRIVARLTSVRDGFELWSRTFAASPADRMSLQVQIATSVADALRIRLDPSSGQAFVRRSNDNPEAYDLYLKARHLSHARQAASLEESIDLFQQAIELDPGYALAYAGLADSHGVLAFNGLTEPAARLDQARKAATQALALDPTLGEAVAHLAHLAGFVDWDWATAERHFRRALTLAPSHPRIRAWFGQVLVVQRRFEEALGELETASRLDPLAPSITYALGEAYLYARRYEDALRQGQRLLETNPKSWGGHNLLARASMAAGRPVAAVPSLQRSQGELWADALSLVATGHFEDARALIDRRRGSIAATQPFTIASLYASARDTEQALTWLERAYAMRQVDLVSLAVDPALAPLHGEPRFQSLVRRLRLKPAAS